MQALPFFIAVYLLMAFVVFWIIRLGVRYGVDDALRRNSSWLAAPRRDPDASTSGRDDRA